MPLGIMPETGMPRLLTALATLNLLLAAIQGQDVLGTLKKSVSNSKSRSNLAIVIGGFVNGLGLVRTLAARGRRVVVVTNQPYDIAQYSRFPLEHRRVRDLESQPSNLANLLAANRRRWKGALVFPTNDESIASLDAYREELEPWYTLVIPPPDSVPYILDKNHMLRAAMEIGINCPECYGPADEKALYNPRINYPVVIKPVSASEFALRFGMKLFVADNPSELEKSIRLLSDKGLPGKIFDLVPGPDSNIYACSVYMDRQGDPVAKSTIRKLRQTPPFFGIARVAELVSPIPGLTERTVEFLRRIGFRGLGVAEFKQDARDGSFQFLEVNGRSVVYNTLLLKSGLDFPALASSDYSGENPKRIETGHWPGVWINLHADILRTVQNCRRERLSPLDYLKPYLRPKTYAVWSFRDPKPFFAQWSKSLKKTGPQVLKKSGLKADNGRNDES